MNKELIGIAIIGLVFFGIEAVAAESGLYTFTLRADRVLTDYIGGNVTADKVNITGLIIQAGQILGYYNKSATDTLLDTKANSTHDHALGVSNVSGLQGILDNKYNMSEADALLGEKANDSDLTAHTGDSDNPHNVTTVPTADYASSAGTVTNPISSVADRTSSRASGTVYQNGGNWRQVIISGSVGNTGSITHYFYTDASNPPTTTVWVTASNYYNGANRGPYTVVAWVQPNHYYKLQLGSGSVSKWMEIDL